jgi:hypothetical protein
MNRFSTTVLVLLLLSGADFCHAQISGNIAYSQGVPSGKAHAEQNERNKRTLTEHELPPSGTSMFLEANVLMNVKAAEYVAVFAIGREGDSVAECNEKMNATVQGFVADLNQLGIKDDRLFVDFVAQNKIYGFELTGDIAREKLVGFELKKNVSIRFQDHALLDKLVVAAAGREIFDLVKVDYVVEDLPRIRERVVEEAARVIEQKLARYERLLDIKRRPGTQVYAERHATYYPAQMYDSYNAYEAETIGGAFYRQRYTVQAVRKSRTFFFNGLDASGFDAVIEPVPLEPVVQFTLYLKVKYEIEQEDQERKQDKQESD